MIIHFVRSLVVILSEDMYMYKTQSKQCYINIVNLYSKLDVR